MCRRSVVAVVVILCAVAGVTYAQNATEVLWGSWYNKDKIAESYGYEYHPDGTASYYEASGSTYPTLVARYRIVEKWTDDANNTWYKVTIAWGNTLPATADGPNVWSLLMKVDPTGNVLEDQAVRGTVFPPAFSGMPGGWHQLYYRDE